MSKENVTETMRLTRKDIAEINLMLTSALGEYKKKSDFKNVAKVCNYQLILSNMFESMCWDDEIIIEDGYVDYIHG